MPFSIERMSADRLTRLRSDASVQVLDYPDGVGQGWEDLVGAYRDALVEAGANDATRVAMPLVRDAESDGPAVLRSFRAAVEALDQESVWTGELEITLVVGEDDDLRGVVPRHSALARYVREHFREAGEDGEPEGDGEGAPAGEGESEPAESAGGTGSAEPAAGTEQTGPEAEADAEPFSAVLASLMAERGLTDSQVCRRANMGRAPFSRIRTDKDYQPDRRTVLALAVGLGLDVPRTEGLLRSAGLETADGSRADAIVRYFIENGDRDVYGIDEALFAYGEPLL